MDPGNGNIALTGNFVGSTTFGDGGTTSAGTGNGSFLALFDPSGSDMWALSVTSAQGVVAVGVTVSASGDIVIGGILSGTADFSGASVTSTGDADIFLAKYSATGRHLWTKHFGSSGNAVYFRQGAFDPAGNLYVVGEPNGVPVDLGCGALPSGMTMFVAEFTGNGACVWSNAYALYDGATGSNYTQSEVLAIDPTGNVVVAGGFYGSVDFGTGALTAPGIGMDVFVQKLDLSGTVQWAKAFGSGGSVAEATGVAVDSCGSILLDGTFSQALDFGAGTLTESGLSGNGDVFLAKLDASGVGVWSESFGDPGTQHGGPIALDAVGNPAFTGTFSGTLNFGGGVLNGAGEGSGAMYVAKFSSAGAYAWAYAGGPPASNAESSGGSGIAGTASAVVTTGSFGDGTLSLDGDALAAQAGGDNVYLAALAP